MLYKISFYLWCHIQVSFSAIGILCILTRTMPGMINSGMNSCDYLTIFCNVIHNYHKTNQSD